MHKMHCTCMLMTSKQYLSDVVPLFFSKEDEEESENEEGGEKG